MKTALTSMTRTQLANLYDVTRKTFVKRCKRDGINLGTGIVMPKIVLQIFEKYGDPRGLA